MASRANKSQEDDATLSSSSVQSPYNLRRNQLQPGGVTKRNTPIRPRRTSRNIGGRATNSKTSSSTSRITLNQSQSSSSDEEEIIEDQPTANIDLSDNEPEARTAAKKAERKKKKLPSTKEYFDYIDDDTYLCKLCTKVSICLNLNLIVYRTSVMLVHIIHSNSTKIHTRRTQN